MLWIVTNTSSGKLKEKEKKHIYQLQPYSQAKGIIFFKIWYYVQHYQPGNASAAQFSTHMDRKLSSSFSSCFLLRLKLASNVLIVKCLHEISPQMFKRWQNIIIAVTWLGVRCKQEPSSGTLFKRTLGRGPEYNEPWRVLWIDNWQENSAWNCWKDESLQQHTVIGLAACAEIWWWTPHTHPSPPQRLQR